MRRIAALRWWLIGVVLLGTMLNYLSRSILGVAAPTLLADLHIGEQQYSWITGAFQIGIMFQPAAGYLLDLIGLRVGLAIFAGAWGLITMAHGLAHGWQALAALRGALGFAEGTAQPGGLKVVSAWFPARERGLAGGIFNIGASFGGIIAPPLLLWASLYGGWRTAFAVAGALAAAWAVLWLIVYRPPEKHPALGEAERAHIVSGQEAHVAAKGTRPALLPLLGQRNLWGIALPRFLADPVWGTLTLWMPLYLATARGFDLKALALTAWLPFVAADLGCLFGPMVVLWLERRGVTLIDARRWAFTLGAVLMTGMMFVGLVHSPWVALALLCLGGFAHQTLSVTVITMASDLFPTNEVGTVAGVAGLCANLGVLLFSLAMGAMVASIGYSPFFVALGLLDLIAAGVLWTLVRAPR